MTWTVRMDFNCMNNFVICCFVCHKLFVSSICLLQIKICHIEQLLKGKGQLGWTCCTDQKLQCYVCVTQPEHGRLHNCAEKLNPK